MFFFECLWSYRTGASWDVPVFTRLGSLREQKLFSKKSEGEKLRLEENRSCPMTQAWGSLVWEHASGTEVKFKCQFGWYWTNKGMCSRRQARKLQARSTRSCEAEVKMLHLHSEAVERPLETAVCFFGGSVLFCFIETRSPYLTQITSNSQTSCLSHLSDRILGQYHHDWGKQFKQSHMVLKSLEMGLGI